MYEDPGAEGKGDKPAISVVICTLDRYVDLTRCVEALAPEVQVDAPAYEVLVIDQTPPDCRQPLGAAASHARQIFQEETGLSVARNFGISRSAADIIAFLDDDAVPCPRWAAEMVAAFEGPDRAFVRCAGGRVLPEWPEGGRPVWMTRMLEGYLAFARGDAGEAAVEVDLRALLQELATDAERQGHKVALTIEGDAGIIVRPDAFRRMMFNLVANAARHGDTIAVQALHEGRWLTIHVDDDGPGIPLDLRDEVFKPFVRLDEARNQDEGGSGLGLPIARDIARAHGGDITLETSPLGGLRASVRLPA